MKMIINDPRYRYTFLLGSVYLFTVTGEKNAHLTSKLSLFCHTAHFLNWVRRNRRSMPTKSKQRRKKKRRLELNTRSLKRPFRGSWRTTRRWHQPPDTSKSCSDLTIKVVFFLHVSICGSLNCQYDYADGISERSSMACARYHVVIAKASTWTASNCCCPCHIDVA